jgi:hypothetical protein
MNMAFKMVAPTFLVVYGAEDPTDEEWGDYLKVVEQHGIDRTMQLVFTEGGGPTPRQTERLNDLIAGRTVPVAVLSPSAAVRAKVKAMRVFNRSITAFPPTGVRDAIVFLEIPASRTELLVHEIDKLRLSLRRDEQV